ncbi:MAG: type II toxin-antitoxin system VapC family toxin [Bryobacterales bacterium]
MRLLLDTHIWIWSMLDPSRLTPTVKNAINDAANERWISPISVWELTILCGKGRVALNDPLDVWVEHAARSSPFRLAPLNIEVALETARVDLPHCDPADAFLAATARVFNLTLVTADETLIAARNVPTLANR